MPPIFNFYERRYIDIFPSSWDQTGLCPPKWFNANDQTQGPYLDTCLGCFSGCPCLIMNRQLMLCYIMFIFIFSSENGFVNVLYSFQFSIVLGSFSEESQLYCIVLYCIVSSWCPDFLNCCYFSLV